MTYPMTYSIKKGKRSGKLAFSGPCPVCASDLKLKEEEIGKRQPCPNCRAIVRPVSAILKAYRLNESSKAQEDALAVLRNTEGLLTQQVAGLNEERDELRAELTAMHNEYGKAVAQINDLRAEVALGIGGETSSGQQDDFLPDLTPEEPQPHRQVPRQYYYPPKSAVPNGVAAALSFFFPGIGQMCQGRVGTGFAFFIGTCIGYALLILPGFVLHGLSVLEAASYDPNTN